MEGPSLFLAAELLKPFIHQTILTVNGNTKFGKERLEKQEILDIFCWGKHLVFQFEDFAFRVHFMLFGSFEAIVNEVRVTGDYPRKNRPLRLQLNLKKGKIDFYSCSLKFIESPQAKDDYDFSVDIMSADWNPKKALKTVQEFPMSEIGDVLLDQKIFAGVGNIIKNETLFITKINPTHLVKNIPIEDLKMIIKTVISFSKQFYKWRKKFELKKHYQIYRKSICPSCSNKVTKKWTGARNRVSYYCTQCQKL